MELPPRNILADTGPLFALIHAGDADHVRAVQFARSFTGRLITTWPVLTEDSEDVRYMRTSTAKYESVDLADASLVAVGERLGVLDVIALDRRDFSRYRTRSRQAFTNHFPERT